MSMNMRWIAQAFLRFADGKGFALLVTLCIAVIVGTAVWANDGSDAFSAPTPPVPEYRSAAGLLQQSLADLPSPTPLSTQSQIQWRAPIAGASVITTFSDDRMRQSSVTGVWSLHLGVDLASPRGEPICAAADGTIKDCGISPISGAYAVISHAGGYETLYSGMAALGAVKVNDRIRAGQTIGFVGSGPIDEADMGPHVHVAVRKDQQYVDPLACWE